MDKLKVIQSKIIPDGDVLNRHLSYWRFKDKKIVFTNGCFDILHRGHVDYLARAASLGEVLIIGLNSDSSVQHIKGSNRPLQDEQSRALIMAAMHFVDAVVLFDEDTPYNLIKTVQPDILVKGSDYNEKEIVGYDVVMAKGGQVKTIDFIEGYSTSAIVNRIKKS